jgi:ribokinase
VIVSCLGDIMLDVIVDTPTGLVADDDTPARITFAAGGQAANVAAWVCALGGEGRVFGPCADTGSGLLVGQALRDAGVAVHGPPTARTGAVVSVVTTGSRSLASDAGESGWLREVAPGSWLDGADWLFVSGYALLRAAEPERIVQVARAAREAGTRVAVDLASASMITAYGASEFRALWRSLEPALVLANEHEWAVSEADGGQRSGTGAFGAGGTSVLALKRGAAGCTFVIDGVGDHRPAVRGPVRDVTGAGDALAAGLLVGGPDLAMAAAARCIARVGAQPHVTVGASEREQAAGETLL